MTGTAAWVARTEPSSVDLGLDPKEALAQARELITRLRVGAADPAGINLDDGVLDVLHAAVEIVANGGADDADEALTDASRLHDFILAIDWSEPGFSERAELLRACSLWAWRLARRAGRPAVAEAWAHRPVFDEALQFGESHVFRTDPQGSQLDDPETLLGLCRKIREDIEVNPARAQEEAEFLHGFVLTPKRVIGLFDERDYFLGETALLAGIASRVLARRDEAWRWFDRSESSFRLTVNAVADWSRVSYQRLALLLEERRFDEVLEQLPGLVDSFERLDMTEDALKCRLIEGLARVEMGEFSLAAQAFEHVRLQAESAHNNNLLAASLTNLVHVFGLLGDAERALSCSKQALPIFARLGKRIHVGKIHWGIGSLLRAKGQYQAAIEAYGSARDEFEDLKMAADVAATRLMIADLHLELGDDQAALREVLFALPIVDEYRLVPEGAAALSLLRESVRQQKVNHQVLRELHGFFEDAVS